MKPLVTVAIPTRNRSAYLRETLESVLRQDYENLEILVSDNASDDDTAEVVAETGRNARCVRYRRNLLPSPLIAHFNQCLAEARGEFFVLLSDDDRISENFVSSLVASLMQNRRATVAVPSNILMDETGRVTRTLPPPRQDLFDGVEFVLDWLWKRCELPVANLVTVMGRTEMMRKLRYQPFPNGLNSDNLLFLQLALMGQVAFCREASFYWRVHDENQSSQTPPRLVIRAGREFQRFTRRDWTLQRLIRSHHPEQQRLLRRGIRRMSAEAYLHNIGFFGRPLALATFRCLLAYRPNLIFLRLVLRHYYHLIRNTFGGRPMSPVNI